MEMRIQLSAIVLRHEAHESRVTQTPQASSRHTHADGWPVEEFFQRAQHTLYVWNIASGLQGASGSHRGFDAFLSFEDFGGMRICMGSGKNNPCRER